MNAPIWADDALWPGPAIVDRLKDAVPDLAEVFMVDDFDPEETEPRSMPAAVVLLRQLRVNGVNANHSASPVEQDWLVVLAVRNAARDPAANTAELGPLISRTVGALLGWKPASSARPLAWKTSPRPVFGKNVSYFPLLFTLPMVAVMPAAA